MLELSRIESGAEKFKKEKFDLSAVVSEVVGDFAAVGERKKVSVGFENDFA